MDDINGQRFRREFAEDLLQGAGLNLIGHLVGEHADDADT